LKRHKGKKPTPKQVLTLTRLSAVGNATFHCFGSAAAIQIIEQYLTGKIIRMYPPISEEWDTSAPIGQTHLSLEL
jgi:hypothetical protein